MDRASDSVTTLWSQRPVFGPKMKYRKIPKISPGAYIFQRPFLRGLFLEGLILYSNGLSSEVNMRLQIDWASLIVQSKFPVLALFYFVFESNFSSTSPLEAYIWRGNLKGRFFASPVWGAYILRGFYMEGLIFGILRYSNQNLKG